MAIKRTSYKVFSNEEIDLKKIEKAKKIILELQNDAMELIKDGYGPFVAAIYDEKGKLIAKKANSVVQEKCSSCHAEMNVIREAEKMFNSYDLSSYNLSLYVTSEPCIMCVGGIMWSGIKEVYFGVPSSEVEKITGFDEGFKHNWLEEFKKRGITVYGGIEVDAGIKVLKKYVDSGKEVYKPTH